MKVRFLYTCLTVCTANFSVPTVKNNFLLRRERHGTAIHTLDRNISDICWYRADVGKLKIELVLYVASLLHSPTGADGGAAQSRKNLHDVFSFKSQTCSVEKQREAV